MAAAQVNPDIQNVSGFVRAILANELRFTPKSEESPILECPPEQKDKHD